MKLLSKATLAINVCQQQYNNILSYFEGTDKEKLAPKNFIKKMLQPGIYDYSQLLSFFHLTTGYLVKRQQQQHQDNPYGLTGIDDCVSSTVQQ